MFQDAPAGGISRSGDGKRWEADTFGLGPFHFFLIWSVRKGARVWENQFIYKETNYKLFAVGVDAKYIVNYWIWHWPLTGIEWPRLLSAPWPSATKNANTGKNYSRFSVRAANLNPYVLRLEMSWRTRRVQTCSNPNLNMLESWASLGNSEKKPIPCQQMDANERTWM